MALLTRLHNIPLIQNRIVKNTSGIFKSTLVSFSTSRDKTLENLNFEAMRLHWITYSLIVCLFIFFQPAGAAKIKNEEAIETSLSEAARIATPTFSVQKSVQIKKQQYKLSPGRHRLLLLQNIFETDNFIHNQNSSNQFFFQHAVPADTRNRGNAKATALPLHKTFSLIPLSTVLLFPNHFFW